MLLQRPDYSAPRSRLADWLELLAASQPARAFGGGDIKKVPRLEGEERAARQLYDTEGSRVEGEITQPEDGALVTATFDELRRRANLLGEVYPFVIEEVRRELTFVSRIRWRADAIENKNGVYLYCLLISSLRLNLLATTAEEDDQTIGQHLFYSEFMYGRLLQICASVALGGYLRGRVISFGYPRPDRTAFLPAHRAVWKEFGAYDPVASVPLGAPDNENDAGIDLIGWLNFPDGLGSKVLIFGQVASGRNWAGKTVIGNALALKGWFSSQSFEHYIPLMLMPFNASDARRTISSQPGDMRPYVLVWEDREFGILMDRDRVAACAAVALDDPNLVGVVDNLGDIGQVTDWVTAAVTGLKTANA